MKRLSGNVGAGIESTTIFVAFASQRAQDHCDSSEYFDDHVDPT
jgi:hypothetical protein